MLFGHRNLYARARKAMLGRPDLPGPLDSLRRWINAHYAVHVLHIEYDTIKIGPHEGRPRLELFIETTRDCERLHKDAWTFKPDVRKSILRKFSQIVAASTDARKYSTDDVHLVSDDFSREAMGKAVALFLQNDGPTVAKKFPTASVWGISGLSEQIVVFYHREDDIARNARSGLSQAIRQSCYAGVKRYDEFDYVHNDNFRLKFDSKENLDMNYEGSEFYYWR